MLYKSPHLYEWSLKHLHGQDLSWYTGSELENFYREVMRPTEILRIGNDVIAIREVCANA